MEGGKYKMLLKEIKIRAISGDVAFLSTKMRPDRALGWGLSSGQGGGGSG